jgi:hypothetical protein
MFNVKITACSVCMCGWVCVCMCVYVCACVQYILVPVDARMCVCVCIYTADSQCYVIHWSLPSHSVLHNHVHPLSTHLVGLCPMYLVIGCKSVSTP